MNKLRFEWHYCDTVFPDFTGLVSHFNREHRDRGKYIVLELLTSKDEMPIIEEG